MDEKVTGEEAPEAPGRLLGHGRDADVYDLGDGRVLRRYRVEYDHSNEIAALRHLYEQGFPVPQLLECTADGSEMIFERIDGPTMLKVMTRRPWLAARYARELAELHRRVHAIAPPPGLRELGPEPEADAEPGDAPGNRSVLHMDLHPDNVLLSPRGPFVIDWSNASAGPAGVDIAQTLVIMTVSEVGKIPLPLRPLVWVMRAVFLRAFRAAAHVDPAPYFTEVLRARLDNPNLLPVEAQRINKLLARA